MKLRRTPRRIISALAAVAAGIVGAFVVASPAEAHYSQVQPKTYCVGEQSKVAFDIFSVWNNDADHVKFVYVGGTFTAAQLGIDMNYYYPVNTGNGAEKVLTTSGVDVAAGQYFELKIKLEWYKKHQKHSGGYEWKKKWTDTEKRKGSGKGVDCHVPEAPKAHFDPTCDNIHVTFQSEVAKVFVLKDKDGNEIAKSDSPATQWEFDASPDKAPLTAYYVDGQNLVKISTHEYVKPQYCGEPTGSGESTCEGLKFTLTNPEDGKAAEVTWTLTPSTGDPVTLKAARGQTASHTFPGTEGLTVSYTPLDGGDKQTVKWEPDPEKCATPTTTAALPNTGTSGLTGIVAAGVALVLAGAGLLTMLFLRRRRATAES